MYILLLLIPFQTILFLKCLPLLKFSFHEKVLKHTHPFQLQLSLQMTSLLLYIFLQFFQFMGKKLLTTLKVSDFLNIFSKLLPTIFHSDLSQQFEVFSKGILLFIQSLICLNRSRITFF